MNVISIIMAIFAVLGGIDLIIGNKIGIGKEFERGILLLGSLTMSMLGMLVLTPLIAKLITPILNFLYKITNVDPSSFISLILSNDMGGAPLSLELCKNQDIGYFNGLVVAAMMGATITFSLPLAIRLVKKPHDNLLLGLMCGFATVPIGTIVAGLLAKIPFGLLMLNQIPLILFSLLVALGLWKFPQVSVKIFNVLGIAIKTLIVFGLIVGIFEALTGWDVIPYTSSVYENIDLILSVALVMSGSFPLLALLSKALKKPLAALSKKTGLNSYSTLGFISTIATSVTTYELMNDMDEKGVVLNAAFSVSAAYTLAGALAFTLAFNAEYLAFVLVGKIVAGISAIAVAALVTKKHFKSNITIE